MNLKKIHFRNNWVYGGRGDADLCLHSRSKNEPQQPKETARRVTGSYENAYEWGPIWNSLVHQVAPRTQFGLALKPAERKILGLLVTKLTKKK